MAELKVDCRLFARARSTLTGLTAERGIIGNQAGACYPAPGPAAITPTTSTGSGGRPGHCRKLPCA